MTLPTSTVDGKDPNKRRVRSRPAPRRSSTSRTANVQPALSGCGGWPLGEVRRQMWIVPSDANKSYELVFGRGYIIRESMLLKKGAHNGGSAPALTADQNKKVATWIELEMKERGDKAPPSVLARLADCLDEKKFNAIGLENLETIPRTKDNNPNGEEENADECTGCRQRTCATCHSADACDRLRDRLRGEPDLRAHATPSRRRRRPRRRTSRSISAVPTTNGDPKPSDSIRHEVGQHVLHGEGLPAPDVPRLTPAQQDAIDDFRRTTRSRSSKAGTCGEAPAATEVVQSANGSRGLLQRLVKRARESSGRQLGVVSDAELERFVQARESTTRTSPRTPGSEDLLLVNAPVANWRPRLGGGRDPRAVRGGNRARAQTDPAADHALASASPRHEQAPFHRGGWRRADRALSRRLRLRLMDAKRDQSHAPRDGEQRQDRGERLPRRRDPEARGGVADPRARSRAPAREAELHARPLRLTLMHTLPGRSRPASAHFFATRSSTASTRGLARAHVLDDERGDPHRARGREDAARVPRAKRARRTHADLRPRSRDARSSPLRAARGVSCEGGSRGKMRGWQRFS